MRMIQRFLRERGNGGTRLLGNPGKSFGTEWMDACLCKPGCVLPESFERHAGVWSEPAVVGWRVAWDLWWRLSGLPLLFVLAEKNPKRKE